jgi:hypothetical protein
MGERRKHGPHDQASKAAAKRFDRRQAFPWERRQAKKVVRRVWVWWMGCAIIVLIGIIWQLS